MKEKGFVFLPPNFNAFTQEEAGDHLRVEFVRWSDLTRSVEKHLSGVTLSELKSYLVSYPSDQLVVILPQASVSMLEVDVPTKKTRQIKQALPFIVEEQTAQDPDNLLLVSDFKPVQGRLSVTAVDKSLVETAVGMFQHVGLEISDLYGIEQFLPTLDQQLLLVTDGSRVFVSHRDRTPFYLTVQQIPWGLKKFWSVAGEADTLANVKLVLTETGAISYSDLQSLVEQALPQDQAVDFYSDKIESIYTYLVSFAATGSNESVYFQSLLIDKFKPKKQTNPWLTLLAPTMVFGAIVLCCHLALTLYNGWQYQQKANSLQAEIYSSVKKSIPSANLSKLRSDRALRSKIKETLMKSGSTSESLKLDNVTSDIINALASFSKDAPYIQRLSYRAGSGETQLELYANSFAQVDQFKESLDKSGYQVTVGSVTNDNGLFKGRLILQAKQG